MQTSSLVQKCMIHYMIKPLYCNRTGQCWWWICWWR